MKKLLAAVCLLVSTACVNAQSVFEGVITYDMAFDGASLPPEVVSMLKGSTINIYIKGPKRRVETKTPMSSMIMIEDEKDKTAVSLMDVMGKKIMMKMNEEQVKKQGEKYAVSNIKYIDETKTIAGYKCKKAEITMDADGKKETATIYYTDELPHSDFNATYKGLKGVPMEYSMTQQGMKITLTAAKVSKEPVPDSKFEIPSGYTETTVEELQKSMGGGK